MQEEIVKSPNDINLYRALTLDNGLRALLISQILSDTSCEKDDSVHSESEPEDMDVEEDGSETDDDVHGTKVGEKTNLAAAALCIKVGTFSDPDDVQGLAHFLEHMIFMGSEKYPEENMYDNFICSHGGSDNAWTDLEETMFIMDVVPKHFKKALDIFANCLIAPLLKTESMDREIESVDSEFSESMVRDGERISIIIQSLAKEGHPMTKFKSGNLKSLKEIPALKNIDVNESLHQFYRKHYSAEHMTLVVQSTETLDTLEEWVREIFPAIPNFNVPPPCFDKFLQPFDMERFHKFFKVIPVTDVHEMKFTWPLPPSLKYYRTKPCSYLAWLIGHEGKGSILAHLRKKFLAVSLTAGASQDYNFDMNSTGTLFTAALSLTETGMDNLLDVILTVFQYLKMLVSEGPKKYVFDEMQAIAATDFRFQELEEPFDYVDKLALNMQQFPCKDYITGSKLYWDYDEKLLQEFLDAFSFDNVNIIALSSRYTDDTCKEVEPWTQCKFSYEDIPSEWIDQITNLETVPYLHLPEPNQFIATDFDIKHTTSVNKYPYVILENEQGKLWFKEDTTFKVPKAWAWFHIISPAVSSSALNKAMAELFCKIIDQKLCEEVYAAELASVYSSMFVTNEGYNISCCGFNHKIPVLLDIVLDHLTKAKAKFEVEKELFEVMKHQLKLEYYNKVLKPEKLSSTLLAKLSQSTYWSALEKRNELKYITLEMLGNFCKEMLSNVYIEALVQGNITKEEALLLNSMVSDKLGLSPLNPSNIPSLLSYEIPYGETYCRVASFNELNSNSVVLNYYQFGPRSLKLLCNAELLVDFMLEPCFDTLRTQEQLGYYVHCALKKCWSCLSLYITVSPQSNKFSCLHVNQRIEEFLKGFLHKMDNMSDEVFQTQLNSLIECKKKVNLNLRDEVDFNSNLMILHVYDFNVKEKQISYLENLQLEDYKQWVREMFPPDLTKRRKLSIQVLGPFDDALHNNSSEISKVNEMPKQKNDGPMVFKVLPYCEEIPSTTYISSLEDFTGLLEKYPKNESV